MPQRCFLSRKSTESQLSELVVLVRWICAKSLSGVLFWFYYLIFMTIITNLPAAQS